MQKTRLDLKSARWMDRHDRETFISELLKSVPTATRADALRLLRWGRTYGRLAEAECNGDWPFRHDAREHPDSVCCEMTGCTNRYDPRPGDLGECPSCRAERIIRETCARLNPQNYGYYGLSDLLTPHFQGDPRGYTVRLQIAGQPLDPYERPALAIPTS